MSSKMIQQNIYYKNKTTYGKWFNHLMMAIEMLVMKQYEYTGLPENIPSNQFEQWFWQYGKVIFFKVADEYMILPLGEESERNVYGYVTKGIPISPYTSVSFKVKEDGVDAVFGYNCVNKLPTYEIVRLMVDEMATIMASKKNNTQLSNVKAVMYGDKDSIATMKAQVKKATGVDDFIITAKENIKSGLGVEKFDLNVNYQPDSYWLDYKNTWNLLLTLLGIQNADNNDKKERLIVNETIMNNEEIRLFLESRLDMRRQFVENINKLYDDLNIQLVEKEVEEETQDQEGEEDESNNII